MLQPLWVEDLVNVMIWSLDNPETINHTYEIGGSENFSLRQIVEIIMDLQHTHRWLIGLSPTTMRALTVTLEILLAELSFILVLAGLCSGQSHLSGG